MNEIVIKVSDELLSFVYRNGFVPSEKRDELNRAILECVELPEGHGELKDIGKCDRKLFYQQCGGADSLITVKTAFDMLLALPTIIEADEAESEE